jgi:hypothetical protein
MRVRLTSGGALLAGNVAVTNVTASTATASVNGSQLIDEIPALGPGWEGPLPATPVTRYGWTQPYFDKDNKVAPIFDPPGPSSDPAEFAVDIPEAEAPPADNLQLVLFFGGFVLADRGRVLGASLPEGEWGERG